MALIPNHTNLGIICIKYKYLNQEYVSMPQNV